MAQVQAALPPPQPQPAGAAPAANQGQFQPPAFTDPSSMGEDGCGEAWSVVARKPYVDAEGNTQYVLDAVCFVYTCRRLIDLSLIAGTRLASRSRPCLPSQPDLLQVVVVVTTVRTGRYNATQTYGWSWRRPRHRCAGCLSQRWHRRRCTSSACGIRNGQRSIASSRTHTQRTGEYSTRAPITPFLDGSSISPDVLLGSPYLELIATTWRLGKALGTRCCSGSA